MKVLEGRVAIVTGASQGLGAAQAKALALAGAKVVGCARTLSKLEALASEIDGQGGIFIPIQADIMDKNAIQKVVDATLEQFGRVDILVNNAQTGGSKMVDFMDIDDELIYSAMDSGPIAAMRFAQAVIPIMQKQQFGRIINYSSGAFNGFVPGLGAYGMAKGAIIALSNLLSRNYAKDGITTNIIWPVIGTEQFKETDPALYEEIGAARPVGYFGNADKDLAPVIVFLASEASGYMTGMNFYLDGGVNGHLS